MGWCSGTELFDSIASIIIEHPFLSKSEKSEMLVKFIRAFENMDWDCQQDSAWWNHVVVQKAMKEVHPTWFSDGLDKQHIKELKEGLKFYANQYNWEYDAAGRHFMEGAFEGPTIIEADKGDTARRYLNQPTVAR